MSLYKALLDERRKRMAGGGPVSPYALQNLAIQQKTAAMREQQGEEASQGGLSNTPPVGPSYDPSMEGEAPEISPVKYQGFAPRMVSAGMQDLSGSVKNALAATAQALGGVTLSQSLRKSAAEDAVKAAKLTTDQVQNATDVHSVGQGADYVLGQALRGLPMMGAMALGGAFAKRPLTGIAVPSAVMNTGGEYARAHGAIDQQEESGAITPEKAAELRAGVPAHAFAAGAGGAAIDAATMGYLTHPGMFGAAAARTLPGHLVRSTALMAGGGAGREAVEQAVTKHALGEQDLTPTDHEGMFNAAAANAAGALPFVAPGHFGSKIGKGLDAAADAAGRGVRRLQGGAEDLAERVTPAVKSAATKAGEYVAGVINDPKSVLDAAPIKQAVQSTKDFAQGVATAEPVKDAIAGAKERLSELPTTREGAKAAYDKLSTTVKAFTASVPGKLDALAAKGEAILKPKKSLVGPMSDDAKTIRDTLLELQPKAEQRDATILARQLEDVLTRSPREFLEHISKPEVAEQIKQDFGMDPGAFSAEILQPLRAKDKVGLWGEVEKHQRDVFADHKLLDIHDSAIEGNEAADPRAGEEAPAGEEPDIGRSNDQLNYADSPDETGSRHPAMTPEIFEQARSKPFQSKTKAEVSGSNAAVRVTKTIIDPATGESKGEPTHEDTTVNLIDLARAYSGQREMPEKSKLFGETEQRRYDDNFKQGAAALLNGWEETGPNGEKVRVDVEPLVGQKVLGKDVTGYAEGEMRKWLRPDSYTGPRRPFGEVENADLSRGQTKTELPRAVQAYVNLDHQTIYDGAYEKTEGSDAKKHFVASKAVERAVERAQNEVVRHFGEEFRSEVERQPAERQLDMVEKAQAFLDKPENAKGVSHTLAGLPEDLLTDKKDALYGQLSKIDDWVQKKQKGEQDSSVDNPDFTTDQAILSTGRDPEGVRKEGLDNVYHDPAQQEEAGRQMVSDAQHTNLYKDARDNLGGLYQRANSEGGKALIQRGLQLLRDNGDSLPERFLQHLATVKGPSKLSAMLDSFKPERAPARVAEGASISQPKALAVARDERRTKAKLRVHQGLLKQAGDKLESSLREEEHEADLRAIQKDIGDPGYDETIQNAEFHDVPEGPTSSEAANDRANLSLVPKSVVTSRREPLDRNNQPYSSVRAMEADKARMEEEQAKRSELLSNPKKLREYAADKGISEKELLALAKDNHAANEEPLRRLNEYLGSDAAKERGAKEQTTAKKISFKDISEAPKSEVQSSKNSELSTKSVVTSRREPLDRNNQPYSSVRAMEADKARMEEEQAKRERLFSDAGALKAYAEDKGISEKEMRQLLNDNYAANKEPLARLNAYLASDAAKERATKEQATAKKISFKDISGDQTPPKAPAGPEAGEPQKTAAKATGETPWDTTDPEVQKQVVADIQKIVGKSIGTTFDPALTTHQAQYDHAQKLISLAATQAFVPSNRFHEAFHAVYDSYLSPEDRKIVYKAFRDSGAKQQIKAFLKDSPEAWEAAKDDPKELMAYGFQAWKAGALKFGPNTETVFGKIVKLYQDVMNWLHDQPGSEQMMQRIADGYFADGPPSPAQIALSKSPGPLGRVQQVVAPIFKYADKLYDNLLYPYDTRLADMGNPHVDAIRKAFYSEVGDKRRDRGMVQEIQLQTIKQLNAFDKLARDNPVELDAALKNRAKGLPASNATEVALDKMIEGHYNYLRDAGVNIGRVENYMPMSWSGEKIAAKRDEFIRMLEPHIDELAQVNFTPEKAADVMARRGRAADEFLGEPFDEKGAPQATHTLDRVFYFLNNAEREPFIHDNLHANMQTYIKQTVRRAEWARRFNDDSSGFEALMTKAKDFGLSEYDQQVIRDYKDDAFAARLYKVNPTIRTALAANTVYQNYRVLGLSIMSNLIDPFGVAIRSGEWSDAWDSYKMAASRMFKSGRMRTKDLEALAEDIGSIQRASVQDSLLERYGGVNIDGKLSKANQLLFKYNGMEGLTRSTKLAGLISGINFIKRHARGYDDQSPRHLRELGLTAADVHLRPDGELAIRPDEFVGLALEKREAASERIQTALNRFVDESVLRPNVGERTRWGSNPYLAPLYHLKQYVFTFNKVMNKKLEHELLEHGNVTPYLMAASYVPIMAGSAMLRDMMLHGGSLPAQNGFLHYAWGQGVMRTGLMGPSDLAELGIGGIVRGDVNDLRQLGGPTVAQGMDAIGAISSASHVHSFSKFVAESLPAGSIIQHYAH